MSITVATKFLVIDDSEVERQTIIRKLYAIGGQYCIEAKSGEEALAILIQQSIDIILCDSDMPIMSGLELLKIVRADSKLCAITFIMILAEANRDYLIEAMKYGVSSVLVVPYTFDGLSERIESAMKNPSKTAVPITTTTKTIPLNATTKLTLLVVDDTPEFLALLSDLFQDEYHVRVAKNGTKALEICTSENPPDLILLDVMMPKMNGFEVAKEIREHHNTTHIPIIFITQLADNQEAKKRGLDLGAIDFIEKPVDVNILKMRVRNFMRYVELHNQLQSDYDVMLENVRLHNVIENITNNDLKAPLSDIIQLAENLIEHGDLNPKQLTQLKMIDEIVLRATTTINLSSELYKMEVGHFEFVPQPVKIDSILRKLVEIARKTFEKKQMKLVVETGVSEKTSLIHGDTSLCYALFSNLLNNACQYADEKSCVTVSMSKTDPMKITVTNEGVVPVQYRKTFFDKYLDTISTKWGGAYATKLIAHAQNGDISLAVSDADNLTIVTVTLPRYVSEEI
jgi:DNA-binding response OmpR family regulator